MWKLMIAAVGVALCVGSNGVQAGQRLTANTLRLAEDEVSPRISIDEMSWLAGIWSGIGPGGESEELWSTPRYGEMVGVYRLIKEARPEFYELMTLSEMSGSLVLRLRHFDRNLRGWEGCDGSPSFPFVLQQDGRFYFDGITFEPNLGEVTIYLAVESKQGETPREDIFRYRRGALATSDGNR